jgi:hypothetical protein
MDWIVDRIKEPSTWAAVAVACVIAGMLLDAGWPLVLAGVSAAGAILLKEKVI